MRRAIVCCERFARRLLRSEEGLVAIEFGILASFLILMLVGAADLGFAARHRSQLEGAVRAGIQEALRGGTEAAVESAVLGSTDLPANPGATVTATKLCYDDSGEDADCDLPDVTVYMEIRLRQDHDWLFGLPGLSDPAALTIINSVRIG